MVPPYMPLEQKLSIHIETEQKLLELSTGYNQKLTGLIQATMNRIAELGKQIDEAISATFVKDNSANNNDNSNQLYSQINEIKSQLQKLQKSMELLKS